MVACHIRETFDFSKIPQRTISSETDEHRPSFVDHENSVVHFSCKRESAIEIAAKRDHDGVVNSSSTPDCSESPNCDSQIDCFAFQNGTFVVWGLRSPDSNLFATLPFLESFRASKEIRNAYFDWMEYRCCSGSPSYFRSTVENDILLIRGDSLQEKLAVSQAMAQSVRLERFEDAVDVTVSK